MVWRRGRPYSQDLRERVLAAADDGAQVCEAAENPPLSHLIHRPAGRILITNRQLTCQHPAAAGWAAFQTVSVRR